MQLPTSAERRLEVYSHPLSNGSHNLRQGLRLMCKRRLRRSGGADDPESSESSLGHSGDVRKGPPCGTWCSQRGHAALWARSCAHIGLAGMQAYSESRPRPQRQRPLRTPKLGMLNPGVVGGDCPRHTLAVRLLKAASIMLAALLLELSTFTRALNAPAAPTDRVFRTAGIGCARDFTGLR